MISLQSIAVAAAGVAVYSATRSAIDTSIDNALRARVDDIAVLKRRAGRQHVPYGPAQHARRASAIVTTPASAVKARNAANSNAKPRQSR